MKAKILLASVIALLVGMPVTAMALRRSVVEKSVVPATSSDDDGTADQGSGDAPGTESFGDVDGTADQGSGDFGGDDSRHSGDDDGTADQGSGDSDDDNSGSGSGDDSDDDNSGHGSDDD